MKYKVVPMNREFAEEMIFNWKYPGEYEAYNYEQESEDLLNEGLWGTARFGVLDEEGRLFGELTIEFFEEEQEDSADDGYVEHQVVLDHPQNAYEMWMGWGIHPDYCGQGLGKEFITSCIDFAISQYRYQGEFVRCAVSSWNQRAISLYQSLGFEIFRQIETEEGNYKILQMKKSILKSK